MQIVAVQLNMAWEDKQANHRRVEALLAQTQIAPGALIILPEMCETGFTMNPAAAAQDAQRSGEAWLRELAASTSSAVMGGLASPLDEAGQSRNEAIVVAPDGSELARYQKLQPFSHSGEQEHYLAGDQICLFSWQGVKIAPFICYDLRFPEHFRRATQAGAELLTLIACWPAVRSEHWVRLLQARAIENLAVTIGVNRSGTEPGLTFDGRSAGFDHMGQPLFEADAREQVIVCDVDLDAARDWRAHFPALRDIRDEP